MIKHILLDSSPLGLLTNPSGSADVIAINQWAKACLVAGHKIYVPEVIDYELRRELVRANKTNGLTLLDSLKTLYNYLPITTDVMLRATDLRAYSRQRGIATGAPKKLDVDVILCAQALTLPINPAAIIVATSNVSHIANFVPAELWTNITP